MLDEVIVLEHFCADEASFKIGVDCTSSLWCLGSLPDGPTPHLICSGCEEMAELEGFISCLDNPVNHGNSSQLLRLG